VTLQLQQLPILLGAFQLVFQFALCSKSRS
jgi:hypothetical protein